MIRTARRPSLTIPMLGVLLAVVAFAPVMALAAGPGAVPAVAAGAAKTVAADSDDAPDHASRLMVMGDFNRDGIADMAEATSPAGDHAGPDLLTVSLGQADGTFQKAAFTKVLGHTPRDIVAGDFNKDGISDLIVGDDDGTLMLFLGDGTGNLVSAGEIAHLDSVVSIAVADFNHDGIPDLAVSDWRASAVTVLLGTGKGRFERGWSFPLRIAGTSPHVSSADFNADGIPDLAVVYADDDGDTFDVMLGSGTGTFTHAPKLSVVKDPTAHCAP